MLLVASVILAVVKGLEEDPCNPVGEPFNSTCYAECFWWGDPHYTTFDGMVHDFQGVGWFQHVTSCSGDQTLVPFDVDAELLSCYGSHSCTERVRVTLYPGSITIILHRTAGVSVLPGIYNYPFGAGTGKYEVGSNYVKVYTSVNQLLPDLIVQFPVPNNWQTYDALVMLNEGYEGFVCGLCGYFDSNATNDLFDMEQCKELVFTPQLLSKYTDEQWDTLDRIGEVYSVNGFEPRPRPDYGSVRACIRNFVLSCLEGFQLQGVTTCNGVDVRIICDRAAVDFCFCDDCLPQSPVC